MQILHPHSLYQTVYQQVRDATRKPFARNDIYIDRAKKTKGFFTVDSCKLPKWHYGIQQQTGWN